MTVAPGEGVQAAVSACPRGGSVLLLPGTHVGPLALPADKEVHVFGRGQATLWAVGGYALVSESAVATCDGLIIRQSSGLSDCFGVWIKGGRLRLQSCDVVSEKGSCIFVEGNADPVVVSCK